MTAPDAGGLSESTGASVSIVGKSLGGALQSTIGVVIGPVAIVVGVVLLVALAVIARRIGGEMRRARAQVDPRDLVDPTAPDMLGVWP